MEKPEIITSIASQAEFYELLQQNPGAIVIKFGATWCGPCKRIEPALNHYINQMPPNVQVCIIDIDECFELYSLLQRKRMVNGVPAILAYYKENISAMPDDSVIGADIPQIDLFFNRVYSKIALSQNK
jgi:thiol-disulfide isomerase/thioredoxin